MKQLTEAQAFRRIAREIEKGNWRKFGLCYEVERLRGAGVIAWETERSMLSRIDGHVNAQDPYDYPWAFKIGEAPTRVIAANFLALEAADDARTSRRVLGRFGPSDAEYRTGVEVGR